MSAPRYSVVRADLERDRPRILSFWERIGFSAPDRAERYDWYYIQNPDGRGRIYLLLLEGSEEIVGTACAGTRWICLPGGRKLRASALVDFAVDPAHRSVGPALMLQRTARESEMREADLLYGLPDTKAVPIFKRLGCDQILQEISYAYVVRTGSYLQRTLPAWAAPLGTAGGAILDLCRGVLLRGGALTADVVCMWRSDPTPVHDALWTGHLEGLDHGIGVRDWRNLSWRFGSAGWRYALVTTRRDSRPVAYMVCRVVDDELIVADMLISGDAVTQRRALSAFLVLARSEPVRVVRLDLLAPAAITKALEAAGFSERGTRPCFIIRNTDRHQGPLAEKWWFTKVDEDV